MVVVFSSDEPPPLGKGHTLPLLLPFSDKAGYIYPGVWCGEPAPSAVRTPHPSFLLEECRQADRQFDVFIFPCWFGSSPTTVHCTLSCVGYYYILSRPVPPPPPSQGPGKLLCEIPCDTCSVSHAAFVIRRCDGCLLHSKVHEPKWYMSQNGPPWCRGKAMEIAMHDESSILRDGKSIIILAMRVPIPPDFSMEGDCFGPHNIVMSS